MALITTDKLQDISNVAAGGTATLKMPIARTYHGLLIAFSGITAAQITQLRIVCNGKVTRTINGGDQLDTLNQFDRKSAESGVLFLNFERVVETKAGRERTAIGTNMRPNLKRGPDYDPIFLSTFSLEMDLAAGTNPVISCKALRSAPRPTGVILKSRSFSKSATGAGPYEIADLPRGEPIQRIIISEGDKIDHVKIELDNVSVFDRTTAENELIQANGKRDPVTGYWIIDFGELGDGTNALSTNYSDVRFTLQMNDAANMQIEYETIGYLDA